MRGHRRIFLILAIIAVSLMVFANLSVLSAVFGKLLSILLPILAGLALAFVLNIPLRFLERLWVRRLGHGRHGLRRFLCLSLCLVLLIGLGALLVGTVLPQLVRSVNSLIQRLPEYAARVQGWWQSLSSYLEAHDFPFTLPELSLDSSSMSDAVNDYLEEHGHRLIDASVELLHGTYRALIDLVLSLVLMLYFLAQKETLCAGAKKLLRSICSKETVARILRFGTLCQKTFANFLTGQLTEALVIGSLCLIGMLLFRMPYALLISVIIGVTALIPIFGAFIGTALGALLILLDNPVTAVWFVVFIIVLQQLETNLIYPRVVGKSVGLPGIWVLVSVTVGSSFGIVGMLISVPLASVLYCTLKEFVNSRLERKGEERLGSNPIE